MEITIKWLDQQIAELRQNEVRFLASANVCNGAANAYEAAKRRLMENSDDIEAKSE